MKFIYAEEGGTVLRALIKCDGFIFSQAIRNLKSNAFIVVEKVHEDTFRKKWNTKSSWARFMSTWIILDVRMLFLCYKYINKFIGCKIFLDWYMTK
jgi:hypothetical protein